MKEEWIRHRQKKGEGHAERRCFTLSLRGIVFDIEPHLLCLVL